MKKSLLILALALVATQAAQAFTVYDPSNYRENLAAKLQMIKQVQNSAQQLQLDIKNLQKLDPSNLDYSLYKIEKVINGMNDLRQQTDAIGTEFGDLMHIWDENNPDYEDWQGRDASAYAEHTASLREQWGKALLQSLQAQSLAAPSELESTGQALNKLLEASQKADGSMGALQAANQLTAMMINEQQKLQIMMADSIRSQNMYQQMLLDGAKQSQQINRGFMGDSSKYRDAQLSGSGGSMPHFGE